MDNRPQEFALVTLEACSTPPTLRDAAQRLHVTLEDLDATFAVVPIDPAAGTYAVRVRSDKLPPRSDEFRGPWSDPKISPFGPPQ